MTNALYNSQQILENCAILFPQKLLKVVTGYKQERIHFAKVIDIQDLQNNALPYAENDSFSKAMYALHRQTAGMVSDKLVAIAASRTVDYRTAACVVDSDSVQETRIKETDERPAAAFESTNLAAEAYTVPRRTLSVTQEGSDLQTKADTEGLDEHPVHAVPSIHEITMRLFREDQDKRLRVQRLELELAASNCLQEFYQTKQNKSEEKKQTHPESERKLAVVTEELLKCRKTIATLEARIEEYEEGEREGIRHLKHEIERKTNMGRVMKSKIKEKAKAKAKEEIADEFERRRDELGWEAIYHYLSWFNKELKAALTSKLDKTAQRDVQSQNITSMLVEAEGFFTMTPPPWALNDNEAVTQGVVEAGRGKVSQRLQAMVAYAQQQVFLVDLTTNESSAQNQECAQSVITEHREQKIADSELLRDCTESESAVQKRIEVHDSSLAAVAPMLDAGTDDDTQRYSKKSEEEAARKLKKVEKEVKKLKKKAKKLDVEIVVVATGRGIEETDKEIDSTVPASTEREDLVRTPGPSTSDGDFDVVQFTPGSTPTSTRLRSDNDEYWELLATGRSISSEGMGKTL